MYEQVNKTINRLLQKVNKLYSTTVAKKFTLFRIIKQQIKKNYISLTIELIGVYNLVIFL